MLLQTVRDLPDPQKYEGEIEFFTASFTGAHRRHTVAIDTERRAELLLHSAYGGKYYCVAADLELHHLEACHLRA